jgi:hypothetical protein
MAPPEGGGAYMPESEGVSPQPAASSIGGTGYGLPPQPKDPQPAAGLSSWITYEGPACCGPIGGSGPVRMETYLRIGPEFPLGDGVFGKALVTGWMIEGGARSLFFDVDRQAAWTVDLSISNTFNHTTDAPTFFSILNKPVLVSTSSVTGTPQTARANFIPGVRRITRLHPNSQTDFDFNAPGVSVKSLNRTGANVYVGREWYLWGSGCSCDSTNWRVGCDVGGTWGTEKVELRELRHRTGVYEGINLAVHSDWEFPCNCGCIFMAGVRLQWDHQWSEVLQGQNDADLMDLNLLFTFGVRY